KFCNSILNICPISLALRNLESPVVKTVRGAGLLNAIEIRPYGKNRTAWDVCISMLKKGLLAKQTHQHIIRFAPPLIINKKQILDACDIIKSVILEEEKHNI
ncbi:MAG: aminotransferase class III-fold pyridoxal phosphate-dependent enzyme, partial [Sphingomonadales bacterium]